MWRYILHDVDTGETLLTGTLAEFARTLNCPSTSSKVISAAHAAYPDRRVHFERLARGTFDDSLTRTQAKTARAFAKKQGWDTEQLAQREFHECVMAALGNTPVDLATLTQAFADLHAAEEAARAASRCCDALIDAALEHYTANEVAAAAGVSPATVSRRKKK